MNIRRKALLVFGITVIISAVIFFFLISGLDALVKAAIEKIGSQATGTEVKVSTLQINLKKGGASISGLSIGNPSGFTAPIAFDLRDITVDIEAGSVTEEPVVIEKVHVSAPRIIYEINESGVANINEIKKNLELFRKRSTSTEKRQGGKKKKLLIRSLIIENGKIDMRIAALSDKPFSVDLPSISFRNLGGKGGATPSEIATLILRPLVTRAVQSTANAGVQKYLGRSAEDVKKLIEKSTLEKLGAAGEEAAGEAGKALEKLFGK
jgi:uncharacterized protein involved in outer membrane biogenesis